MSIITDYVSVPSYFFHDYKSQSFLGVRSAFCFCRTAKTTYWRRQDSNLHLSILVPSNTLFCPISIYEGGGANFYEQGCNSPNTPYPFIPQCVIMLLKLVFLNLLLLSIYHKSSVHQAITK